MNEIEEILRGYEKIPAIYDVQGIVPIYIRGNEIEKAARWYVAWNKRLDRDLIVLGAMTWETATKRGIEFRIEYLSQRASKAYERLEKLISCP